MIPLRSREAILTMLAVAAACTDPVGVPPRQPFTQPELAAAAEPIPVVDLGTLPGFTRYYAYAINDAGWVVGTAYGSQNSSTAFLWKPGVGMIALATLPGGTWSEGYGINERGDISGAIRCCGGFFHATLWRDGVPIDLEPVQTRFSRGYDVNDAGDVVGHTDNQAFRWREGSGMQYLEELPPAYPGGGTQTRALAVNNSGTVVGSSWRAGELRAIAWLGGVLTDLTADGPIVLANAVNAHGVVAGEASFVEGAGLRAAVWKDGAVINLGILPSDSVRQRWSGAGGINDAGDVVGWSERDPGEKYAVLWSRGAMTILPSLSGTRCCTVAHAINNRGQVVGESTRNGDVQTSHAVLWTVAPPNRPPTADAGGPYAGRKKKEAIAFDARGSSDLDSDPLAFVWDFGDGTPSAVGATASHVYEQLGTYLVRLTVSDGRGGVATATARVDILPPGKLDR